MSDPIARGRQSRRKGADFERRVAALLRDLGIPARRTLQSRSGREGSDVQVEGYHVEAKTGACPNLWAAMAQARRDSEDTGLVPIVVSHREAPDFQRAEEVMVLPLHVGLALIAAEIKRRGEDAAGV